MKERIADLAKGSGGPYAIASALGVTPTTIYGWIEGSRPQPKKIARICSFFGVNREWLEHGTGAREMTETPVLREEPASAMDINELCGEIAEMVSAFSRTPDTFKAVALARIEERYAEFRKRAQARTLPKKTTYASKP